MLAIRHLSLVRMARYSRFLLKSIFNTFLRPPVLVFLITKSRLITLPDNLLLSTAMYVLSIPASEILLSVLSSRRKRKERDRLGALPIPKVKGKKLGNIDVLRALIEADETEYPGDIFFKWAKEYGPTYDMNILWASQIVSLDPENTKFVLSSAFTQFEKGEKFHDMFETFWGDGIFTTDGDAWRTHRANARPFFAQERLSNFSSFEEHVQKMLDILDKLQSEERGFDLQDLFARYTLDTATEFLFGLSTECLDGFLVATPDAPYERFMRAFNELADLGAKRIRIGSTWPLFEITGDQSLKPAKIIHEFVEPIVEMALRQAGSSQDLKEANFLEYLARVTPDKNAVRDESLNILFAARDTTSSLLTWIAYILMEHPEVENKMREEVLEICGDRVPDYSDVRRMKYIDAVLNETLRLFPSVPYNIRRSIHSSALPSPYSKLGRPLYMPPRSSFTFVPVLMHRDPAFWGTDAAEFKPERWLSSTQPMSHPSAFVPFNMGPRICLGQQLAYIQTTYVWARLLQHTTRFVRRSELQPLGSLPPTNEWLRQLDEPVRHSVETVWPHASVILRVKGGLWVRMAPKDT